MQKVYRLISVTVSVILCFFLVLWITGPVAAASSEPVSAAAATVSASTDPVSINDLVGHSSEYNNQTITIRGEAIGERLERQDGCWVNISDGTNAIGIWATQNDAARIAVYGDYKHTGDTVTVTGVFYDSCRVHGGEPDVHASSLIVDNAGAKRSESISVEKIISAVCIVSAALILFIIYTSKNRNISR